MSDYELPASSPSVQGVEAEGVQALLDALEGTPGLEPHSLMVLRHGYVVASGWWYPYTPSRLQLMYSVSKSFTSTAAGLVAGEGLLDVDRPVVSYFPELDADITDARSRSILVRHVASMASGHTEDTWPRAKIDDPAEPVRGFLRIPPDRDPGTVFAYNQSCTYTLAAIVQRLTGDTLSAYLQKRLPRVFGDAELRWQHDRLGRNLGFSGLYATTETIARLGLLYLDRGTWEGERVLDPHWVSEATRVQVVTAGANMNGGDWEQGYGYQFWTSRHGYRADGAYGQFCLVLPDSDTVVAITSQTNDAQALLDAVWDNLLPALLDGPVTESGSDARLRERLSQLAVPSPIAEPLPPAGGQQVWVGATFLPEGGASEQQPLLSGVSLSIDQSGWRVALREADCSFSAPMGNGAWAVTDGPTANDASVGEAARGPGDKSLLGPESPGAGGDTDGVDSVVPLACMGGWVDPGVLRFDVIFLETPHRLRVTCRIPEHIFDAQWVTAPLFAATLGDLRAPA